MSGRQHTETLGGNAPSPRCLLAPPQRRQGVSGRRPSRTARQPWMGDGEKRDAGALAAPGRNHAGGNGSGFSLPHDGVMRYDGG